VKKQLNKILSDDAKNTDFNFKNLFELNQMNQNKVAIGCGRVLNAILNISKPQNKPSKDHQTKQSNIKENIKKLDLFLSTPNEILLKKENVKI